MYGVGHKVSLKDHPRSRGVYRSHSSQYQTMRGSSPLARGLRDARQWFRCLPRIIPARAGFTISIVLKTRDEWDHPRSRGVYPRARGLPRDRGGSSPLARGLQQAQIVELGQPGIIPARAGFTPHHLKGTHMITDHPRSRGVYNFRWPAWRRPCGSSPLARGLLFVTSWARDYTRIIPARAGFTISVALIAVVSRDHPRSRGVYSRFAETIASEHGSSPLARGLRPKSVDHADALRIIPARAGFTSPPVTGADTTRGIIPARAGFTARSIFEGAFRWDHPRSRGVYPSASRVKMRA